MRMNSIHSVVGLVCPLCLSVSLCVAFGSFFLFDFVFCSLSLSLSLVSHPTGCSPNDKAAFNGHLIRLFTTEYNRLPSARTPGKPRPLNNNNNNSNNNRVSTGRAGFFFNRILPVFFLPSFHGFLIGFHRFSMVGPAPSTTTTSATTTAFLLGLLLGFTDIQWFY